MLALEHESERRADCMQRVLFHTLTYRLRPDPSSTSGSRVLIVAAPDRLGRAGLEALSRRASKAGVRLFYLFTHLREAVGQVLGGEDAASLFMRLGNTAEAAAAADFVGREHKFVLSQLTLSMGQSFTQGSGETDTWQEGTSESTSSSDGFSKTPG